MRITLLPVSFSQRRRLSMGEMYLAYVSMDAVQVRPHVIAPPCPRSDPPSPPDRNFNRVG